MYAYVYTETQLYLFKDGRMHASEEEENRLPLYCAIVEDEDRCVLSACRDTQV